MVIAIKENSMNSHSLIRNIFSIHFSQTLTNVYENIYINFAGLFFKRHDARKKHRKESQYYQY